MKADKGQTAEAATLRDRAEEQLRLKEDSSSCQRAEDDARRLLHELQIHQIELEMQNAELSQAKEESETVLEKYTDLYDFAPIGYLTLDLNGIINAVNLTGATLLGIERFRLIGRRLEQYVAHESRPHFDEFLGKVFTNRVKKDCEIAFLKEGKYPFFVQIEAVAFSSGQECRAVFIDITERKRAEESLRESNALFEVIFDQALQSMGLMKTDGTLIKINRTTTDFIEAREAEVLGKPFWETPWWTHSTEDREKLREAVRSAAQGEFVRFEATHLTPAGKLVWVDFSLKPVKNEKGEVIFLVPEWRDITAQKQATEQIEILNSDLENRANELEAANIELEAFNYTVSHDLRRPLTTINAYCQVLKEMCSNRLDEQCKGYLQEAYTGTLSMNELINALLSFSRLSHAEPCREIVDLSALAHEEAEKLQYTDPERNVTFRIAQGIQIVGDRSLLRVVMENLLNNAWKFTGKLTETVIELGATEVAGQPAYFVRDNGSGFDMACADKLFTPFHRLPGSEEYSGHGIGLATVARIIKRHGGRVWALGEPEKGATFFFSLSADEMNKEGN
ncbi:MAG: PAS domain S-box protein [Geobacter sp.]|nr:PAS domain S-box protein [Geobacter sp.]